jgi:aspartate/methionine/tyrosine aminotransferase
MPRAPELSAAAMALAESIFTRLRERLPADPALVFPFHLGDTHLPPPEASRLEAQAWDETFYRYGTPAGEAQLIAALATKLRERNGIPAHAGNIQITCGATHAFACAARAMLEPDDEILLLSPFWPLIRGTMLVAGARPVEVPFTSRLYDEGPERAGQWIREFVTPRTSAIYVTTPNNPDGKVLGARELGAVAEVARAADLWVLADEVYEDVLFDGRRHLSIATLPGMAERTVTVFSFSKSYAQAGLRVGYAVGPEPVMTAVRKIANHTVFNVPHAMQRAALGALTEGAAFLETARGAYQQARDLTVAMLKRAGVHHHVPEGGSYVFLSLGSFAALERLAEAGLLLAPGDAFGRDYAGWARLCYTAVPRERLEEGLARMELVLTSAGG